MNDEPPEGRPPGAGDPPHGEGAESPPERTSGLILETCYRHPQVATGVHCTRCGRPICPDCMHEAPVGYHCPECVREARRTGRRVALRVGGRTALAVRALIAANVVMYVVEVVVGGSAALATGPRGTRLCELGAMFTPAIVDQGQYWRLVSAMFLHAGLIHLLLNMYGLYLFGTLIENAFGAFRFLAIYFVSGLLGSVLSFTFSQPFTLAVGASGAVFGLLGAWVAYNYRRRGTALASANLQWALMLIGINLVLGFSIAGIDNFAHLGGLAAGVVAGTVAEGVGPRGVRGPIQVASFAALILIGIALVAWRASDLGQILPIGLDTCSVFGGG